VTVFLALLVVAVLVLTAALIWAFPKTLRAEKLSAQLESQKDEAARLAAEVAEARKERDWHLARLAETKETLASTQSTLAAQSAQAAAELRAAEEKTADREAQAKQYLADIEALRATMKTEFEAAAAKILGEKAKTFAEQNSTQLGQLLDPFRQRLIEFRQTVEHTHKDGIAQRSTQHGELKAQLEQLRSLNTTIGAEAQALTTALKGNAQVRGAWGELVLERLLESAGLRKGENYFTQESLTTQDGRRLRPDVVIRLPEGRHLVIDSKVSLVAYERAANAPDDTARSTAAKAHVAAVRAHIDDLSGKRYDDTGVLFTPDYVLMFVPVEPAFALAVQEDTALYDYGFSKRVILLTAASLLVTLKTIAALWNQDRQNKNVEEIAKRGGALYDKFEGFLKDLEEIGARLHAAQTSYSNALSKLYQGKRGTIYSEIDKLRKLGAKTTKRLPPVPAAYVLDEAEKEANNGDDEETSHDPEDLNPMSRNPDGRPTALPQNKPVEDCA